MKYWRFMIIMLPVFLTKGNAAANTDSLDFREAGEIILNENQELKAFFKEIDASTQGVTQANVRSNPSIGVAVENFGVKEIEASVEQTFELGGKRNKRTKIAMISVDEAKNAAEMKKNDLESEIVRRFIPVVLSVKKLSLIDSLIALTEKTKEQIRKRVDEGAAKKTDLIRAEIEMEHLQIERDALLSDNIQARRIFAALGGESSGRLLAVKGTYIDSVKISEIDEIKTAASTGPALKAIEIEKEQLKAEQMLYAAQAVPDLDVCAAYVGNPADRENALRIGVSMGIPLFDKNTGAQKQAELKYKASELRYLGTLKQVEAQILDLTGKLEVIDRKIAMLSKSTIPKAENVYSMMQEYYVAGSVNFSDLAYARAEMLRLGMELLELQSERAFGLAELMQITSAKIEIIK